MCHSYKPLVPKSESSLIVIFKAEMHWRGHVLWSKIHCVLSWKIIYSRHNLHNKYSLTSSFSPTTFAFFTRPEDPQLASNGSSRAYKAAFGAKEPWTLLWNFVRMQNWTGLIATYFFINKFQKTWRFQCVCGKLSRNKYIF